MSRKTGSYPLDGFSGFSVVTAWFCVVLRLYDKDGYGMIIVYG